MQTLEDAVDLARGLDEVAQIGAGARRAAMRDQHGVLEALADEIVLEPASRP